MWTEELRFCPRYCECTCSQRHVRVADTFPDGMSQRFMCLGYYYSSESGPGSFMATRDELRTVSQYKIEAATVPGFALSEMTRVTDPSTPAQHRYVTVTRLLRSL